MPGNINYENYQNAPERKHENVRRPIHLNDIVMETNIQEPNDDDMKIEKDKIDEIKRYEKRK